MSLRQVSSLFPPQAPLPEITFPFSNSSQTPPPDLKSKNFVLADMDGRNPRDNRACPSCMISLSSAEIGQINWHLTADEPCRLCQIAEGKPEAYTKPFIDFLQENPTVFHTVDYFEKKLSDVGFTKVCSSWQL